MISQPIVAIFAQTKTPSEARETARKILAGKKYRDTEVNTPLNGPLSGLGRAVRSVFRRIGDFIGNIVPGGPLVHDLVIGLLVIAGAVLLAKYLMGRKWNRSVSAQMNTESTHSSSHWEKLADEAYASGDFRTAIVYRFRSGIARLEHGPQPAAARLNNSVIGSQAPTNFPPLGTTFDAVRYGNDEGSASAADASKQQWPNVVTEISRGTAASDARGRKRNREQQDSR
jgi:hypothetical protein